MDVMKRWDGKFFAVIIVIFRIMNGLNIQTFFNPDEYWQSLEIAHLQIFGYGYKTWEWSDEWAIRTYLYPSVFAVLYHIMKKLGFDQHLYMILAPRVVQGTLAGITDVCIYRCARRWFGTAQAWLALLCAVANWFMYYSLSRTLSNSAEACFSMFAFYYWPIDPSKMRSKSYQSRRRRALIYAAIACMIRPSNALLWIPMGAKEIRDICLSDAPRELCNFFIDVVFVAVGSISVLVAIDSYCYGFLVFTPLNFFRFNVALSGSALYGTHPWYWYWVVGLPAVIGSMMPCLFAAIGYILSLYPKKLKRSKSKSKALSSHHNSDDESSSMATVATNATNGNVNSKLRHRNVANKDESKSSKKSSSSSSSSKEVKWKSKLKTKSSQKRRRYHRQLLHPLMCCLFMVFLMSFGRHKEFRFLLPIMPLMMVYCGVGLWWIAVNCGCCALIIFLAIGITNVTAGLFLCVYHQHAPISIMASLAADIENVMKRDPLMRLSDISVHFLTNCHSTPYYSYLHLDTYEYPTMRFLDCSPYFDERGLLTRDFTESWYFEHDPKSFIARYYSEICPTFVVISNSNLKYAMKMIDRCEYSERARYTDNYFDETELILFRKVDGCPVGPKFPKA